MKTLDRYIIRSFLFTALMCFVILMGLRVVIDLFVNMDEFAKQDKDTWSLLREMGMYYGYQSLLYFADLGGIIITISAAFTLAMMNHTNELTTILSAGVSLRRVVLPIIVCSLALGALITLDQELVIPKVADKLVRERDQAERAGKMVVKLPVDARRSVWYAPVLYPDQERMEQPVVFIRDDDYQAVGCIIAKESAAAKLDRTRGWMFAKASLMRGGFGSAVWPTVPNTSRIHTSVTPESLLRRAQEEYRRQGQDVALEQVTGLSDVDGMNDPQYGLTVQAKRFIPDPPTPQGPWTGQLIEPRFIYETTSGQPLGTIVAGKAQWVTNRDGTQGRWELVGGMLFYPSNLRAQELMLRQSSRWLEYMSSRDLTRLLELDSIPNPASAVLTKQSRITQPIVNLIMLLLALPFILSRERNIKASAGMCLLVVAVFFVFVHICRHIGMGPMLGAWLPVLLFAPPAVLMFDSVKT
jgi:lipopolysaccharide export LptBFGC system permease protein LptF